jgi:hypothetical protein
MLSVALGLEIGHYNLACCIIMFISQRCRKEIFRAVLLLIYYSTCIQFCLPILTPIQEILWF